jgi:uncharacterized protein (DUF1499 family)
MHRTCFVIVFHVTLSLAVNFTSQIIGSSPTTVLIETSNDVSGISVLMTLFTVQELEVSFSVQIMNIRSAFHTFNRLPI